MSDIFSQVNTLLGIPASVFTIVMAVIALRERRRGSDRQAVDAPSDAPPVNPAAPPQLPEAEVSGTPARGPWRYLFGWSGVIDRTGLIIRYGALWALTWIAQVLMFELIGPVWLKDLDPHVQSTWFSLSLMVMSLGVALVLFFACVRRGRAIGWPVWISIGLFVLTQTGHVTLPIAYSDGPDLSGFDTVLIWTTRILHYATMLAFALWPARDARP